MIVELQRRCGKKAAHCLFGAFDILSGHGRLSIPVEAPLWHRQHHERSPFRRVAVLSDRKALLGASPDLWPMTKLCTIIWSRPD
jgi:hypothetical protein